jgi:hypothetical protein
LRAIGGNLGRSKISLIDEQTSGNSSSTDDGSAE